MANSEFEDFDQLFSHLEKTIEQEEQSTTESESNRKSVTVAFLVGKKSKSFEKYLSNLMNVICSLKWIEKEPNKENWDLLWSNFDSEYIKTKPFVPLKTRWRSNQRINHWPHNECLTSKRLLFQLLNNNNQNQNSIDFLPTTFLPPLSQLEIDNLHSESNRNRLLIMKPSSGARGEGIMVDFSRNFDPNSVFNTNAFVIQFYVENPHLVKSLGNRKYHMRRYVCLNKIYPQIDSFLHCLGYVHLANSEYKQGDLSDRSSHVTNWDQQHTKQSYELSNSFFSLEHFQLEANFTKEEWEKIESQIVKISSIVMKAAASSFSKTIGKHELNIVSKTNRFFEMFGFDFLIDSSLKVWLLEVNGSPSLEQNGHNDVDSIKTIVLSDLLRKCGFSDFSEEEHERRLESLVVGNLKSSIPKFGNRWIQL